MHTLPHQPTSERAPGWFSILALFFLALAPRTMAPGRFITVDEAYHWFERAHLFAQAIQRGDYAGTNLIGHPGVTTLWLGAAGVAIHQWLANLGWLSADNPDTQRILLRLPLALVASLCVALAYPLLRRLLSPHIALLATLLWAGEPFLVAHAQILHLDALLASFMTLALLAALVAINSTSATRWWMISGVCAGLALLTKSPSLALGPAIGMIALAGVWWRSADTGRRFSVSDLRAIFLPLLIWGVSAAIVWVALWPAAWLGPVRVATGIISQARDDGGVPHAWGNFFLGQAVADPGPLFYPVALALRITPWAMAGLLLAGLASIKRRLPQTETRIALLLAAFVILFILMMSIPPKKFDRYALPVVPALDILAAIGLVWAFEQVRKRFASLNTLPQMSSFLAWLPVIIILGANLAWHHPYEIAYYNQALGGGRVAARLIPVGWGEGYELAGAYISAQPDGADLPVAAWYGPVLQPYVKYAAVPMDWALTPGKVDYAVVYIDQIQRNDKPETFHPLLDSMTPVHTVVINAIEYAYIYQIPRPIGQPVEVRFGDAIQLHGYTIDSTTIRSGGYLGLKLQWQALKPIAQDYNLFVHIINANGQRIGQADLPPGGGQAPTSVWGLRHYIHADLRIPMPADTPAGDYWVMIGVYDPHDFARLPLAAQSIPGAPNDGENAFGLVKMRVP